MLNLLHVDNKEFQSESAKNRDKAIWVTKFRTIFHGGFHWIALGKEQKEDLKWKKWRERFLFDNK